MFYRNHHRAHLQKFHGLCITGLTVCLSTTLFIRCAGPHKVTGTGSKVPSEFVKNYTFDRTTFGQTSLPLWYGLTPFEEMALSKKSAAMQGDPDALLALAIVASGDVRDSATYEEYRLRVHAFIDKIRPAVKKLGTDEAKGKFIFEQMTNTFFKQWANGTELLGYRFGQSKLSEIFRTGHFNCISSSLLYIVCARHFDLRVRGVEIPSHIFVQLTNAQGINFEIETTIKEGFGLIHDKKFYEATSSMWYTSRNLKQATYQDYLHRTFYEPYQLIAGNMFNQHTGEDRMATEDRNRLLEASGYLDSLNPRCITNRLSTYNNEFVFFQDISDDRMGSAMFDKVGVLLPWLLTLWGKDTTVTFATELFTHQYYYSLLAAKKTEQALALVTTVVNLPVGHDRYYDTLIGKIQTVSTGLLHRYMNENLFDEGLALLKQLEAYPIFQKNIGSDRMYLYERWANFLWDKKSWNQITVLFEKALVSAPQQQDKTRLMNNMANAYLNWGNDYWEKNEWPVVVEKCSTGLAYAQTEETKKPIASNLIGACINWSTDLCEKGAWESALEKISLAIRLTTNDSLKQKITDDIAHIYWNWGSSFFKAAQWAQAMEKYSQGLDYAKNSETARGLQSNIEAAYVNWLNKYPHDKEQRKKVLAACLQKCPECSWCKDRMGL